MENKEPKPPPQISVRTILLVLFSVGVLVFLLFINSARAFDGASSLALIAALSAIVTSFFARR
jgi:hypothetical protein